MTPPTLSLEGLEVAYGTRSVLRGLDASLSGRAIGLLGPNGAGKTTLINTILGFCRPRAGRVRILGLDPREQRDAVLAAIGYMPENDAYIAEFSAVHMLRLLGEVSGLPRRAALERTHQALHLVGLGEERYRPLSTYSLGMRQRVKLAQALIHAPAMLLLDEPTNGLDPAGRRRMLELIGKVSREGGLRLLISSHLLQDVEQVCDEVLILRDGRVAACCNLEEERRTNRKFVELEVAGGVDAFSTALSDLGCHCAHAAPGRLKVILPPEVALREIYQVAATEQVQLRRLAFKRDSLEDLFLDAMERTPDGHS